MNIKEIIKNGDRDNYSHFLEYRKGNLWYRAVYGNRRLASGQCDENGVCTIDEVADEFHFPVPINDTGDGTFKATHRSIELMRYIRKHLTTLP